MRRTSVQVSKSSLILIFLNDLCRQLAGCKWGDCQMVKVIVWIVIVCDHREPHFIRNLQ